MSKWNKYKHMQDLGTIFCSYYCGLSINKNKSNILIFNNKNQPEYIENIHVTTNTTYLEVKIQNKRTATSYKE